MLNSPIMTINQFQPSLGALVKKVVGASVSIPVTILKKLISFQIKVWSLPVIFVVGGVKNVLKQTADTEPEPPMPSSDEIARCTRKLQNSVLMSITSHQPRSSKVECPMDSNCEICLPPNSAETVLETQTRVKELYSEGNGDEPEVAEMAISEDKSEGVTVMTMSELYGDDLMWDVPLLAQKAIHYADCLEEGDPEKIKAAKRALEEHPVDLPRPQSRSEYEQIAKALNGQDCTHEVTMSHSFSVAPSQTLKSKSVSFREDGKLKAASGKENQVNILKTCLSLLEIVSNLNYKIDEFIEVSLGKLKEELDSARKLLNTVENDRNELMSKISTLEKLIKEEQEYLDDISGESGYDETENIPECV